MLANILRTKGVVSKFIEFYGDGLDYLSVVDRATIANMNFIFLVINLSLSLGMHEQGLFKCI